MQCNAHEQNIRSICSNGVGNGIAYEQIVICRQAVKSRYSRSSSILPAPLSFLTNSRSVMLNSTSPLSSTCTSNPAIPGTIKKWNVITVFTLKRVGLIYHGRKLYYNYLLRDGALYFSRGRGYFWQEFSVFQSWGWAGFCPLLWLALLDFCFCCVGIFLLIARPS